MKKLMKWMAILPIILVISLSQSRCKKQHLNIATDTTLNIVGYLRANSTRFSEFIKILDRTNISPYLNAYGAYTCFAPTNDAIALYLQKIGKTSTDQLDTATLRSICRLHLIQDTLSTRNFTDGKMPTITLYGQYLITSIGFNKGSATTLINRQAFVTLANVVTGNGYVHEIDHVLEPSTTTLAQMITANPKYSIYAQALKTTGLYDSLNIVNNADTTRRWLTLMAESDSVLNVAGYPTYAALKARFSNTGNPLNNPSDSLYMYMAYHIVTAPTPQFVADIVTTQSLYTMAPMQVLTITVFGQSVLLNQVTFNNTFEAGIPIDRSNSDYAASNGVMHNLLGDVYMKIRVPVGVYFDVCNQPELVKLPSIYHKASKFNVFSIGQLADVTWPNGTITYNVEPATSTNFYQFDDYFSFSFRAASTLLNYIEFKTPLLVQGKYKVWICVRRAGQGFATQVSVDDVPLSRVIDLTAYLPSTTATDAVLESQGFKRYATVLASAAGVTPVVAAIGGTNSTQVAQLAGVVNIATTDRHRIRLTCLKDGPSASGVGFNLDMIQFIPVNNDQQYPRFKRDGTQF